MPLSTTTQSFTDTSKERLNLPVEEGSDEERPNLVLEEGGDKEMHSEGGSSSIPISAVCIRFFF